MALKYIPPFNQFTSTHDWMIFNARNHAENIAVRRTSTCRFRHAHCEQKTSYFRQIEKILLTCFANTEFLQKLAKLG